MMRFIKFFFSLLLLITCLIPATSSQAAGFKDISSNRSSASSINKMTTLNIVGGYSDGTFKPQKNITRAELANILAKITNSGFEFDKATTQFYTDIPLTHWAADAINVVTKDKIMTAYAGYKFEPNRVVTRAEFAQIIANYMNYKAPSTYKINFKDVPKSSPYYEGVRALVYKKITSGTSATLFSPNAPLTREQIAIFLDRTGLFDEGLEMSKTIDFSSYYTKGDQYSSPEQFTKMVNPLLQRWLFVGPIKNGLMAYYEYSNTAKKFQFDPTYIVDGEYYYILSYGGWGNLTYDEQLMKLKFENKKFVGFKIYSPSEIEQLKSTKFASDIAFSNYLKKYKSANQYYLQHFSPTNGGDTFQVEPFNYDANNGYLSLKFEKPGTYYGQIYELGVLFEFDVKQNGDYLSYTYKELQPVTQLTFDSRLQSFGVGFQYDHEHIYYPISTKDNQLFIYDKKDQPLKPGTKASVYVYTKESPIEKYYEYTGSTFVEISKEAYHQ